MRWTVTLLCLVALLGGSNGDDGVAKGFIPTTDPVREVEVGVKFLESVPNDDRPFIRLGSTYSVPTNLLPSFKRVMGLWWRQLTLNPNRKNLPSRVPDSDTLYWFDLRSFDWNHAAWNAVAQRDKAFREPWIPPPMAERMRLLIGEKQPKNFHLIGIVDLWSLYRRTYDTDTSSDYYDLLFAKYRFPYSEEGEKRELLVNEDGVWKIKLVSFSVRKFTDFPKNREEWLSAMLGGTIKVAEYEKALQTLRARKGAVAKGMNDARAGGSFVARNNRLIWVGPSLTRIGGIQSETFDVVKTAGKRDLEENAFTDQGRDKGRVFKDGGELLFTLPAGDGLAALLVNAKDERVEEVPGKIAIHTRNGRDRRVLGGVMVCLSCHADAYGWIPLNNVLEKKVPHELDVHFKNKYGGKDRQAAEDYDAFFLGWQDDLKGVREITRTYWSELTKSNVRGEEGPLTGVEIGSITMDLAHAYDDPVGIDQMCREVGLPEALIRVAASRSVLLKGIDVARKDDVSRASWDEDVFPELMKIASSTKEILEGKLVPVPKGKP